MPAAKPVYGVLDVASANERTDENRTVVALLLLVTGLAAATIWFVALPLFDTAERRATGLRVVRPDGRRGHQVRPGVDARNGSQPSPELTRRTLAPVPPHRATDPWFD